MIGSSNRLFLKNVRFTDHHKFIYPSISSSTLTVAQRSIHLTTADSIQSKSHNRVTVGIISRTRGSVRSLVVRTDVGLAGRPIAFQPSATILTGDKRDGGPRTQAPAPG